MDIFMPPCHCNSADLRDDLCFLCLASCGGFTVLNSFIALSVPLPSSVRTSRLHDWPLPPIRYYNIVSLVVSWIITCKTPCVIVRGHFLEPINHVL